MVLRTKNFNILRFHRRIRLWEDGGWGVTKNQTNTEGGLPKRGKACTVSQFKGGRGTWKERGGGLGGGGGVDAPKHTTAVF